MGGHGGDVGFFGGLGAVGWVVRSWSNNQLGLNTTDNPDDLPAAPANLGAAELVTGTQTVLYDAGNGVLSFAGTINVDGDSFAVNGSQAIDLAQRYSAPLYIGFTGGTGQSYADQRITAFSVSAAIPEPGEWALMLAGLGLIGAVTRMRARHAASA